MNILIVGAGLSGCTIARLLKDNGHTVSLIEKEDHIGGLCITRTNEDGVKYEPFGARTFHTNDSMVREFVTRFDDFNGYVHRKGMILNNKIFPFPISRKAIRELGERDTILQEINHGTGTIEASNFEQAAISIFGKTLYSYFVENYTNKMWGMHPSELTADWAPKRLKLGDDDNDALFKDQWQGLPVRGYSYLLGKMVEGIPVALNTTVYNRDDYDVVVSTAPLDQVMRKQFGKLRYRSLKFYYKKNEFWEKDTYGTINLPQHPRYIRKCNFNVLHKAKNKGSFIQYQEPVESDSCHLPMYPVNTKKQNEIFHKYLEEITLTNICPLGRLGLFKYLDMDKAISVAFHMIPVVENYPSLSQAERYEMILKAVNNV